MCDDTHLLLLSASSKCRLVALLGYDSEMSTFIAGHDFKQWYVYAPSMFYCVRL